MRVSTILATKGASVATIDPQTSVADVVDELRLRGVGALVVSRDGLTVRGSSPSATSCGGSPSGATASCATRSPT
jgi:CBS domain-containing protein